jgi:glycerophosphoryl diester phosphodiesterase
MVMYYSCKKIVYYPDVEIQIQTPKWMAHRGGRSSLFRENTLEGIHEALRLGYHIELDVQISKDETIWLSHGVEVIGCNQTFKCFPESTDAELRSITTCNGKDISYSELEDVYRLIHDSFPDRYIAVDLKNWRPCSVNSLDIEGMMRKECDVIIGLAEKYGLVANTLIETETSSVLNYVKYLNSDIGAYQTSFGDFERGMLICLKNKYSGLSFKTNIGEEIDRDKVDLLHRKGLKLMVWNLIDEDEAIKYSGIGVDYIQFDLK